MVGGKVIEVCDYPGDIDALFVDVRDKNDTCAVLVEKNETSKRIEIGDSLWWQCGYCYWTPQGYVQKSGKCHVDYDIAIRKLGYSGVTHPSRRPQSESEY